MPSTPAITARVNITATNILGSSVACVFTSVTNLEFDYYKGMVRIVDAVQGEFFFSLLTPTTITYTIAGKTSTVVIT